MALALPSNSRIIGTGSPTLAQRAVRLLLGFGQDDEMIARTDELADHINDHMYTTGKECSGTPVEVAPQSGSTSCTGKAKQTSFEN